ncbi:MAG: biotin--[acetyl-CoA-carboxylase] ligase [Candidatus Pacebacteria bacterium]|nr:biotin--[acetyl-CoA-carboxylase] ligase [Candidatus Paceibacterota bacterium]
MEIRHFKSVSSTSDKAKELANAGYIPWTTIVAEEQTDGHGRKGEAWFSPKGGLYFSVILPKNSIDDLQTITILAAFKVAKTIKESFGLEPMIKLPNDVLINDKKFCGILTENIIIGDKVKLSVIGIGINTNIDKFPESLKDIATSVKIEANREIDNQILLNKILEELKNQFNTINQ